MCGRLTDWPHGFQVDHIVPLSQGGIDGDSNLQVLCAHKEADGTMTGCHEVKTAKDLGLKSGNGLRG